MLFGYAALAVAVRCPDRSRTLAAALLASSDAGIIPGAGWSRPPNSSRLRKKPD
jgi:hypothetical protein